MMQEQILDILINNGLVGPWSWSDMLSHAAHVVAYGILRYPELDHDEAADRILSEIRGRALEIVRNSADD